MNRSKRIANLKHFSHSPAQLYHFLEDYQYELFSKPGPFRDVLMYGGKEGLRLAGILLGDKLAEILDANAHSLTTNYWGRPAKHNMEYPRLINGCAPYLTDLGKSKVLDRILKYQSNFYSSGRKSLSISAVEFLTQNDSRALPVLEAFYRILPKESFDLLMDKTENGMQNKGVERILKKTKRYKLYNYTEESIKDPKVKIELLKDLARSPSLVKKLEYDVRINVDDIKQVAPAMRFKFLQFIYKRELYFTRYGSYYRFNQTKKNILDYRHKSKLKVPLIPVEEMKEILFSVSLQKNAEVTKWLDQYQKMIEVVTNEPEGIYI